MAEIKIQAAYKVQLIEYERGWGSKVDETKYFDTKESAMTFVNEFNSKNTSPVAPDWYMVAEYCGKIG